MATIGSGTKTIPNVVTTATWRSTDIDQGLAAFAEQLGGVGWSGGVPLLYGGNLDSTNIPAGLMLGPEYLAQPNARTSLTIATSQNPGNGGGGGTTGTYSLVSPQDMVITRVSFGAYANVVTVAMSGYVSLKVNDATRATVAVATDQTGASGLYLAFSASTYIPVRTGDRLTLDISQLKAGTATYYGGAVNAFSYPMLTMHGFAGLK